MFVCHAFLQGQVGSELLFYQSARVRTPVSFDMLDPVLYVAWRILKLLLKLHRVTLCGEKFFLGQHFFLLKVYKFHHTILVHFQPFQAAFKIQKFFTGACPWTHANAFQVSPPQWQMLPP